MRLRFPWQALWLRPMLARPLRLIATILGVAIGVASVISTLLASRAAVASLRGDVEEIAGPARLEVTRPGGVEVEDLGLLRELCGEVLIAPVVEGTVLAPARGDLLRVLGLDLLLDASMQASGPDWEAARSAMLQRNGVALSRRLAGDLRVGRGNRLEVVVRSRRVALEVAAIFEPPRFASAWERTILADVALAQELFGRTGRLDRIELLPRASIQRGAEELASRASAALPDGYRVAPPSERREEGERLVRALDFNLTALSGVSLLVAIVLVSTTLATSVVQRSTTIALLRSLGASRAQISGAIFMEAGAIGLAGGALGILAGWKGALLALPSMKGAFATLAEDAVASEIRLETSWVLAGLALGFFTSIAAALLPLQEALRTAPLQGLRAQHEGRLPALAWRARAALSVAAVPVCINLPPWGDRPVWALLATLFLLFLLLVLAAPLVDLLCRLHTGRLGLGLATPLRLAQAALRAGRRRASWAAGAVGVALALAVAMTTMIGSFRTTVVGWTAETMRADLTLRPLSTAAGVSSGRVDPEVARIACELFGTASVDPYHEAAAYAKDADVLQRVACGGADFEIAAREEGVPFLDGRSAREVFEEALARGGAVVNEPFARRFKKRRGDTLELETPRGRIERPIAGVYRDYSGHTGRVVLDLADFLALYPDEGAQSLALYLPFGRDIEEARRALSSALLGRFEIEILNNRELRADVLAVFERTFAVTAGLQLIASIVASIAMISVLFALVRERAHELAIVRTLGASRVQIGGIVLGQSLLLALAGALGGLAVGLVIGYVLVAVVNPQSFGWTLRFVPPWDRIGWTIASVIPACLVAALAPALVSIRSAPREALREAG